MAQEENLAGLKAISRDLVAKAESVDSQQQVVKTSGRLVKHARYYRMLLAEGHLSRRLFGSMLRMIAALPLPAGNRMRRASKGALRSCPGGRSVSAKAGWR